MKKKHIGSNLDGFLAQDGLLAACEAGALKRTVAWKLAEEMKRRRPRSMRQSSQQEPTEKLL